MRSPKMSKDSRQAQSDDTPRTSKVLPTDGFGQDFINDSFPSMASPDVVAHVGEVAANPPELPASEIKFKAVVVEKCLARGFLDRKTKLSKEALVMMEYGLRLYVMEMLCRSAHQAQCETERSNTIDTPHMEQILPQIMLDF